MPHDCTVMTWNVLAQAYVKPDRYPLSPPEDLRLEPRRQRIVAHLVSRDADVLCLQEVEPDLFEAVQQALPEHTGIHGSRPGRPDGSAVFFRTAAFSLHEHEILPLEEDHVAVVAHLGQGDQRLGIVSTHLRWQRRDTPREAHVGRRQLLSILEHVDPGPPADAWIIAGDFNALSESVVLSAAMERGWRLSCRSQRPWDTVNINGRRRKLDYLLYRPGTLVPRPGALPQLQRDTPMPGPEHPSDHLPVEVVYTRS